MKKLFAALLVLVTVTAATAQDKKTAKTEAKKTTTTEKKEVKTTPTVTPATPVTGNTTPDVNTANPNAPKMVFKEETHEFGELPEGPQATYEFKFSNTGKEALVLTNVHASCGCTTPSWPKDPILPGKEGTILVTYNTQGRVGNFTKSVTINSNAAEPNKVIYIKGEVIKAEPEKSVPAEAPSMLSPKN